MAGSLFDRMNKVSLVAGSLAAIGLGYLALANFFGPVMFYGLGIFLGLGWGVAMAVRWIGFGNRVISWAGYCPAGLMRTAC